MFTRFASAAAVASAALGVAAFGALLILTISGVPLGRFAPVLLIWCLVPAIWGMWAIAAPGSWTPDRLPVWGAILGVMLGSVILLVLDLPSRIGGFQVGVGYRLAALVVIVLVYYLLWMLVRLGFRMLAR